MDFEQHCRMSEKTFGVRYERVHSWLDEFSVKYSRAERYKHRKHRHHAEGIEEARELFGDLGALVAEQHIRADNEGSLPQAEDYLIREYE
ncbi:MAG TPA: hypothetical protein VJI75_06110 [Candidatus Nanoarchaeia archaeon]|nr:hypothetical protein [Candidatus Nanoarchaeia archaeon]